MKPVMTSVAGTVLRQQRLQLRAGFLPLHRRAQRAPLHHRRSARASIHCTPPRTPRCCR